MKVYIKVVAESDEEKHNAQILAHRLMLPVVKATPSDMVDGFYVEAVYFDEVLTEGAIAKDRENNKND